MIDNFLLAGGVVPIPNESVASMAKDYRPISITPAFSKEFECHIS